MPPEWEAVFATGLAGLVGLVVGSFLNVVIWRLPRGQNLSRPRSACPACGQGIQWFDNVPVLSWLLLRGRCRNCRAPIAARYPAVELLTGVLFVLAFLAHAPDWVTAGLIAVALAALVAITFIDWDHKIIPDKISLPGLVFGLLVAPFVAIPAHPAVLAPELKPALDAFLIAAAGAAVGAGVIYAIRWIGSAILRKEAMGLGDVKLLAFIGAFVGPLYVLYALILGCLVGALVGVFALVVTKRRPIPCGVEVRIGGADAEADAAASFRSCRIRDGLLWLAPAPAGLGPGAEVTVDLALPASKVLEDEDVRFRTRGVVKEGADGGPWKLALPDLTEAQDEHMAVFAQSYRYIPFGPFLSIGGAATMLYGPQVHWFLSEGYPRWVRGQVGG